MDKKIIWEKWIEPEIKNERDQDENLNMPVLFTIIGYFSQKLYSGINNKIKFWVGNTNFPIDETSAKIIDSTLGVEIFSIITPYKFRISVGKAFKSSNIRRNIELNLGCQNKFNMSLENLYLYQADRIILQKSKRPWIIFILPNGQYESYQNENEEEFNNVLTAYKEAEKLIPGILLTGV